MIAKKVIIFTLCSILALILLLSVFGCPGQMRNKRTSFDFGKEYFLASDYPKAMIRLEKWVQENPDTPEAIEAHAMLVIIYHDDETRQNLFEAQLKKVQSKGDQVINAIFKLLEDPTIDSRLRNSIRSVLVKAGQPSVIPLMQSMRGTNPRIRKFAQETLSEMGPVAVDALVMALDDPDLYVRGRAIEALSQIGDKRAAETIKKKLDDPSKLVQVEAAAALHKMGVMNPTNTIISALNDPDAVIKRAAAKAASEMLENPPLAPLLKAVNDEDQEVRAYAVLALGNTRSPEAVQTLIKIMTSDDIDNVKNSAAKALEKIGKPALEPLIQLLEKTKDVGTLIRIVQTLGDIGDKSAIKPMERVYSQANNPLLKNETAKALNKIPD